jgi:hypothetical protein
VELGGSFLAGYMVGYIGASNWIRDTSSVLKYKIF